MNNKLTLMGFSDCPNTPKARELLDEMGINYDFKLITEEEAMGIPEFYGSPSFLQDGKNIEEGSHSWSCRLVDWEKLRSKLKNQVTNNV